MTPDYRALCAELLAAIQLYTQLNPAASDMSASELTEKLMDAMAATVAALAQPVPERPTDEEIARFLADRYRARMDNQSAFGCPDFDGSKAKAAQIADARAVLARWGRPTPQPVAVSERLPEPSVKVIAHYFNALGKGRTICAIWVPAKSRSDGGDLDADDFLEYDEESDKYHWPEGWYEAIENWEELGWAKVYEGEIAYWQPLPQWPAHTLPTPEAKP